MLAARAAARSRRRRIEPGKALTDRRTDPLSLIAGVLIVIVGALMALDQSSDVSLSGGVIAALFVGVFGLILLVSGLLEDR